MILQELKNIKETPKDLRKFGITIGSVLLLISAILYWNEKGSANWFLISGSFLILAALIYPNILKPLNKIWMGLAVLLGFVMTKVILAILFFLVLTPIALIAKISGKKFLDLNMNKAASSYWIKRNKLNTAPENYEKQF